MSVSLFVLERRGVVSGVVFRLILALLASISGLGRLAPLGLTGTNGSFAWSTIEMSVQVSVEVSATSVQSDQVDSCWMDRSDNVTSLTLATGCSSFDVSSATGSMFVSTADSDTEAMCESVVASVAVAVTIVVAWLPSVVTALIDVVDSIGSCASGSSTTTSGSPAALEAVPITVAANDTFASGHLSVSNLATFTAVGCLALEHLVTMNTTVHAQQRSTSNVDDGSTVDAVIGPVESVWDELDVISFDHKQTYI